MRITKKMLEIRIDYLNKITGNPTESWTKTDSGYVANIGNYHLSQAYGGYCLHQMSNKHGGVTTPLSYGHVPARELFEKLVSFIDGYETCKRGE